MKIYDISQEVFGCQVYPDDPLPEKKILKSMNICLWALLSKHIFP